jgi:apoptosis-inducing factor 2
MAQSGGVAFLGLLWGIVLGDWFVRMVKAKSLSFIISSARASVGQK